MAGTMGYKRMQRLTHDMENVFSEIRNGKITVQASMVDVLFRGLDALENYLEEITNSGDEGQEDNEDIIKDLNAFLDGSADAPKVEEKKEEKEEKEEEAVSVQKDSEEDESVFRNM